MLVAALVGFAGAAPGGFAAPLVAAQDPLPPDTVNQAGLGWDLQAIGTAAAPKPFRFSLCEGRYLTDGEVSRPCTQANNATVRFGHNAPYVFSAGHGKFLPKGMFIDGNGILQGDDPKALSRLRELPLCVRQLDVERCKTVRVAKDTVLEPDPVAQPLANGPAQQAAGGMSFGKAVLTTVGLVAATTAGIAAYQAAKELDTTGGGACGDVTRSACCIGSGGGCGIPAECQCPGGLRDGGICRAGAGCSNFMTPGSRICNGC
jgi:hypothetical protein